MANIATNEILVIFKDGDVTTKEDFVNDLKVIVEIYNDPIIGLDDQSYDTLEISFGSRWKAPKAELEKLAEEYKCAIYGVAYEWGCLYIDHYEINGFISNT